MNNNFQFLLMVHMFPYSSIVVNIPRQYRRNNRIASCYNYRKEHFQYRSTLFFTCALVKQLYYSKKHLSYIP